MTKNKLFFMLLGLLVISTSSWAENRRTKLSTSFSSGNNNFSENGIALDVGISERALLMGSYTTTDENNFNTTIFTLGIDYKFTDALSLYAEGIKSENDDELIGKGFESGGSYEVSHLWDAKLATDLSFDVGQINYTQNSRVTYFENDDDSASLTQQVNRKYSQRYVGVGIDQEITERFSVGIYARNYNYNDYTAATATERRGRIFSTPSSSTDSSIKNSRNVHFSYAPAFLKWFDIYLRVGKSEYKDGTKTEDYTLRPKITVNNLGIGVSYSRSKSGTKEQTYFSPTLSYRF